MAKYKAKVDTVFNFTFIRAGKIIVAGEELRNSPNFECLDSSPKKSANAGDNNTGNNKSGGNVEYAKALQRGKELGIPMYNRIPKEELFAAIAKAEAERAAPSDADKAKPDGDKAKLDKAIEAGGNENGGENAGNAGDNKAGGENTDNK